MLRRDSQSLFCLFWFLIWRTDRLSICWGYGSLPTEGALCVAVRRWKQTTHERYGWKLGEQRKAIDQRKKWTLPPLRERKKKVEKKEKKACFTWDKRVNWPKVLWWYHVAPPQGERQVIGTGCSAGLLTAPKRKELWDTFPRTAKVLRMHRRKRERHCFGVCPKVPRC